MYEYVKELIEIQKEIHAKISVNNTTEIDLTGDLRMLLLNLQIKNAKISELNGIKPIAIELNRIIEQLHSSTDELVRKDRQRLRQATDKIYKTLFELIDLLTAYNEYIQSIINELKIDIKPIEIYKEEDFETWRKNNVNSEKCN
jgi:hypothetical protein